MGLYLIDFVKAVHDHNIILLAERCGSERGGVVGCLFGVAMFGIDSLVPCIDVLFAIEIFSVFCCFFHLARTLERGGNSSLQLRGRTWGCWTSGGFTLCWPQSEKFWR